MASIGEKREWDVSEIEEGASVAVYGIPINVSPVRESRKKKGVYHFNAHLSDGKRCVRVVLFDTSHLEVMKKAEEEKASVLVDNMYSLVKKNMVTQELEVLMNQKSKVGASPHKLSLGPGEVEAATSRKVSKRREIVSLRVNQGIDVVCKVIKVSDVVGVQKADGRVLKKRDVAIRDSSGCIHVVLW